MSNERAIPVASTIQRIDSDRGEWVIAVARHTDAPTFSFDVTATMSHLDHVPPPLRRSVIACRNMTREQLEEHVRNCQAVLSAP